MPTDTTVTDTSPYGWDWTTTTHTPYRSDDPDAVGSGTTAEWLAYDLLDALAPTTVVVDKGLQGWQQSFVAYDADGYRTGAVFWGGRDDVMVQATSAAADATRPRVTSIGNAKTARVDTRVDTLRSYEDLAAVMRESADMYGSLVTQWESDVRGVSRGRTLMVGAPTSAIRIRLYEKWLESPGQYVEGTNRVEVQLRPPSKSKREVSHWTPAETFCASRATRDLSLRLFNDFDLAPKVSLHTSRGPADLERTVLHMGRQYRGAIGRFRDLGGELATARVLDLLGLPLGPAADEHADED